MKTTFILLVVAVIIAAGVYVMLAQSTPEQTPAGQEQQDMTKVQIACESALMYTTFPDGASADAFVRECVEGKHPEVIERYEAQMKDSGAAVPQY